MRKITLPAIIFSTLVAGWFMGNIHLAKPAAAQVAPEVAAPKAAAAAGLYTDPVYGFTITAPKFGDDPKARAVPVIFSGPPKNAFAPNINVLIDPQKTNRKDYLATARDALAQGNAKIHSIKETQMGNHDAAILDYEMDNNNRQLRFLQLVLVADDVVYVVTCTATQDSFAALEPDFQKCLDSFTPPK